MFPAGCVQLLTGRTCWKDLAPASGERMMLQNIGAPTGIWVLGWRQSGEVFLVFPSFKCSPLLMGWLHKSLPCFHKSYSNSFKMSRGLILPPKHLDGEGRERSSLGCDVLREKVKVSGTWIGSGIRKKSFFGQLEFSAHHDFISMRFCTPFPLIFPKCTAWARAGRAKGGADDPAEPRVLEFSAVKVGCGWPPQSHTAPHLKDEETWLHL